MLVMGRMWTTKILILPAMFINYIRWSHSFFAHLRNGFYKKGGGGFTLKRENGAKMASKRLVFVSFLRLFLRHFRFVLACVNPPNGKCSTFL